jgi:cytochrome oxidase Cu insertion factor (SCO1/SenC/PrrC family)
MSKKILMAAILICLALILTARDGQAGGAGTYKIGSKVADFAFTSDQGKRVKLSDYRGKTVVLTMFATW